MAAFAVAQEGEDLPWTVTADGLSVAVRLTPRGGRDALDGMALRDDGRMVLKARVRAAPEDGKANDSLMKFIAKILDVAPSAVDILSGQTSRVKILRVAGDGVALSARLQAQLNAQWHKLD